MYFEGCRRGMCAERAWLLDPVVVRCRVQLGACVLAHWCFHCFMWCLPLASGCILPVIARKDALKPQTMQPPRPPGAVEPFQAKACKPPSSPRPNLRYLDPPRMPLKYDEEHSFAPLVYSKV